MLMCDVSEIKSRFPGGVRKRLHAAVIKISASIKHDLALSFCGCAFCYALSDRACRHRPWPRSSACPASPFRGTKRPQLSCRLRSSIVRIDVLAGAKHRQSGRPPPARRTCRRTFRYGAWSDLATVAIGRSLFFLPSLRKIYSPAYFTPLPLYGSGLRNAQIWAATWPTFWPSIPLTTDFRRTWSD